MKKALRIFTILLFLTTVFFLQVPFRFPVYSDDVEEYQSQIEETEELKQKKEEVLNQTQSEIDKIAASNTSIDQKISQLNFKIKETEDRLKSSEESIAEKQKIIIQKEEELNKKREVVDKASSKLYKNQRVGVLESILSQNDADSLIRTVNYRRYALSAQMSVAKQVSSEFVTVQNERNDLAEQRLLIKAEKLALDESKVAFEEEKRRIQDEYEKRIALQKQIQKDITRLDKDLANLDEALQDAILAKVSTDEGDNTGGGNYDGDPAVQPPSEPPSSDDDDDDDGGDYKIYLNGDTVANGVPGPVRVVSHSGTGGNNVFRVNSSLNYRGVLEFRRDSNMYMINELPFEMYLRGLGEVPSSWPSESLKAQAVAGRSYAVKNWDKRDKYEYNLRDDTYDQNYTGYNKESASHGDDWVSAVNATKGKILEYDGKVIAAYYHSTCGGHTLSSEEVWVSKLGYTRPESDWYQKDGKWVSYDNDSPWSYKKWGKADIKYDILVDLLNASLYLAEDPDSSKRQKYIRREDLGGLDPEELVDKMGSKNTITSKIGKVKNVKAVYNNGKETVTADARKTDELIVVGEDKTIEIEGKIFRIVYNARSPKDNSIYYSNFWTVVKKDNRWDFYTRGYPHRVGMCQYGAYGRAKAGQKYDKILSHYYRDTKLKSFSASKSFRVGITRVGSGSTYVSSKQGGGFDVYAAGTKILSVGEDDTIKIKKK